jgi:hypothetical protein
MYIEKLCHGGLVVKRANFFYIWAPNSALVRFSSHSCQLFSPLPAFSWPPWWVVTCQAWGLNPDPPGLSCYHLIHYTNWTPKGLGFNFPNILQSRIIDWNFTFIDFFKQFFFKKGYWWVLNLELWGFKLTTGLLDYTRYIGLNVPSVFIHKFFLKIATDGIWTWNFGFSR